MFQFFFSISGNCSLTSDSKQLNLSIFKTINQQLSSEIDLVNALELSLNIIKE